MDDVKFLEDFAAENGICTKGSLGLLICLTRDFIESGIPTSDADLLTARGGQVRGISGEKANRVLIEYGIERALSSEAGRTSRGSVDTARNYVQLLKEQGDVDLKEVEAWWVKQVQLFFDREPFVLRYDAGKSFRAIIRDLLEQATARQAQETGTMYCGIVLEHLVGAKLELIHDGPITHHSASAADENAPRDGDFVVGNVVIHVTTSPTKNLIDKCRRNLQAGKRPLIITIHKSVVYTDQLCDEGGIAGRVEVFEAEQFLVSNFYEHGKFETAGCKVTAENIIGRYNGIIDEVEGNPSLRIESI